MRKGRGPAPEERDMQCPYDASRRVDHYFGSSRWFFFFSLFLSLLLHFTVSGKTGGFRMKAAPGLDISLNQSDMALSLPHFLLFL